MRQNRVRLPRGLVDIPGDRLAKRARKNYARCGRICCRGFDAHFGPNRAVRIEERRYEISAQACDELWIGVRDVVFRAQPVIATLDHRGAGVRLPRPVQVKCQFFQIASLYGHRRHRNAQADRNNHECFNMRRHHLGHRPRGATDSLRRRIVAIIADVDGCGAVGDGKSFDAYTVFGQFPGNCDAQAILCGCVCFQIPGPRGRKVARKNGRTAVVNSVRDTRFCRVEGIVKHERQIRAVPIGRT